MKADLRLKDGGVGIIWALSALTVMFCLCDALLSYAALPFYSILTALFALVYCFDKSSYRLCSLAGSVVSLALCAVFSSELLIFKISALLCGLVIALCVKKGIGKAETALYGVLIFFAALVLALYLEFSKRCGSYNPSEVRAYYFGLLSELKDYTVRFYLTLQERLVENGSFSDLPLTFEEVSQGVNSVFCRSVATVIIFLFLFIGVALKIFRSVAVRLSEPSPKLFVWRFKLKPMIAYFYLFLVFCSFFIGTESLLDIAVMNLYLVFGFTFAYIGLSFLFALLSDKHGKALALIILFVLFVLIGSFALDFVSILGALISIIISKFHLKSSVIIFPKNGDGED